MTSAASNVDVSKVSGRDELALAILTNGAIIGKIGLVRTQIKETGQWVTVIAAIEKFDEGYRIHPLGHFCPTNDPAAYYADPQSLTEGPLDIVTGPSFFSNEGETEDEDRRYATAH